MVVPDATSVAAKAEAVVGEEGFDAPIRGDGGTSEFFPVAAIGAEVGPGFGGGGEGTTAISGFGEAVDHGVGEAVAVGLPALAAVLAAVDGGAVVARSANVGGVYVKV